MENQNQNMLAFDIVLRVTKPFIILPEDGTAAYIKIDTAIAPDQTSFSDRVRATKSKDGETQSQEPMHVADVTNIQTGEVGRMIFASVLESQLKETYPDDKYIGKIFQIARSKTKGGRGTRKYWSFDITEIRLKTAAPATQTVASKK